MAQPQQVSDVAAAEATPTRRRPKVIYVLGAHRSGSTILGVTLGNCADVFFAGELHSWFSRAGVPTFGGPKGARLWRAVRADVKNADELIGDETQYIIDRSSSLYRVHKWRAARRLRSRYRRATEEIYYAIAKAANASCIVDTSHYPLRARELQRLEGIDLYLLYVVRDAQGVVASLDPRDKSTSSKSPLVANAHLWVTHALSLPIFLRHSGERRLFVRHEEFLADPAGVISQILRCVGLPDVIPDLSALSTGCPLQGNHLLRSEVVALRGPGRPPERPSRMTRWLQLPWQPILSRLRPVAGVASGGGYSSGERRGSTPLDGS